MDAENVYLVDSIGLGDKTAALWEYLGQEVTAEAVWGTPWYTVYRLAAAGPSA